MSVGRQLALMCRAGTEPRYLVAIARRGAQRLLRIGLESLGLQSTCQNRLGRHTFKRSGDLTLNVDLLWLLVKQRLCCSYSVFAVGV